MTHVLLDELGFLLISKLRLNSVWPVAHASDFNERWSLPPTPTSLSQCAFLVRIFWSSVLLHMLFPLTTIPFPCGQPAGLTLPWYASLVNSTCSWGREGVTEQWVFQRPTWFQSRDSIFPDWQKSDTTKCRWGHRKRRVLAQAAGGVPQLAQSFWTVASIPTANTIPWQCPDGLCPWDLCRPLHICTQKHTEGCTLQPWFKEQKELVTNPHIH